jgi:hypothetical protein
MDFKQCPGCGQWFSMTDLLESSEIRPLGLTFESADYEHNFFYFNHVVAGCGTTFLISSQRFIPAIDEPIPPQVKTLGEGCEARCVRLDDWLECHNDCFHAPFRRLLRRMGRNRNIPMSDEPTVEKARP